MEQAAQAAKSQQANRARSEAAEKILEREKSQDVKNQKQPVFQLNPDGHKQQDGSPSQKNPTKKENSSTENTDLPSNPQKMTHIDIKI